MTTHLIHKTAKISLAKRIRVEWSTWAGLAFVGALLEGGVLGIIIKNGFMGQVEDWLLNLAVAVATGAPYFSNLFSFYWVKLSKGKSKAILVSNLAVLFCLCAILLALVPFNSTGLLFFLALVVISRVVWSGILTIRSNIWRANYPRYIRGKVTAKLATMASFIMAISGSILGWLLDWQFDSFRWIFILFALMSIFAAYRYRKLAVRNQHKEIERETADTSPSSFLTMLSLLVRNPWFGKYMLAMFTLGSGNLMFSAPLIVYLNEYTSLQQLQQILITTAIPLALIPIAVGWWAKLLDGNHIFYFRSIHSWGFVAALTFFLIAQISNYYPLFYLASIIYGVAISGGVIGWNLGHNDFVNKQNVQENTDKVKTVIEKPMDYMAVHVTLTGLRGLLMPLFGIAFYQWLEAKHTGYGVYALILPLSLTSLGAILFTLFNTQHKKATL
jgi:MFS family permease